MGLTVIGREEQGKLLGTHLGFAVVRATKEYVFYLDMVLDWEDVKWRCGMLEPTVPICQLHQDEVVLNRGLYAENFHNNQLSGKAERGYLMPRVDL
ncbi:mannan endo-1,4-beta-mannosidase [Babesia caballi]|uniref:Mannan endo-1,4-beta-mannosidase n=1 Tax=Babesia caballi TaxID=5871 RepID=A0AAV4LV89_BABCB|nr:mannan endo-1,4-beta-mannosidase [Babesia caballi]